jgi:hypothetical protein
MGPAMMDANSPSRSRAWMRFQLRDLLLITAIVAVAVAWWLDHRRLTRRIELYEMQVSRLRFELDDARKWGVSVVPSQPAQSRFKYANEFLAVLDPKVDWYVFQDEMTLFKNSPMASSSVPLLIARLEDPEPEVRTRALSALGVIKQNPEQSVPAIIPHLNDAHANVAWHAANALGEFGPDAASAVGALRAKFHDDDSPIATHAGLMWTQIDPSADIGSRMLALIHSPIRENRWRAVAALPKHMDRLRVESALSKLFETEEDKEIRTMIADALNRSGK